jgi:hypothetical protein
VSRKPTTREFISLTKLLQESRYHYQSVAEEAKAAIGTYAVPKIANAEVAAWAATTRILLNMDAFITRE